MQSELAAAGIKPAGVSQNTGTSELAAAGIKPARVSTQKTSGTGAKYNKTINKPYPKHGCVTYACDLWKSLGWNPSQYVIVSRNDIQPGDMIKMKADPKRPTTTIHRAVVASDANGNLVLNEAVNGRPSNTRLLANEADRITLVMRPKSVARATKKATAQQGIDGLKSIINAAVNTVAPVVAANTQIGKNAKQAAKGAAKVLPTEDTQSKYTFASPATANSGLADTSVNARVKKVTPKRPVYTISEERQQQLNYIVSDYVRKFGYDKAREYLLETKYNNDTAPFTYAASLNNADKYYVQSILRQSQTEPSTREGLLTGLFAIPGAGAAAAAATKGIPLLGKAIAAIANAEKAAGAATGIKGSAARAGVRAVTGAAENVAFDAAVGIPDLVNNPKKTISEFAQKLPASAMFGAAMKTILEPAFVAMAKAGKVTPDAQAAADVVNKVRERMGESPLDISKPADAVRMQVYVKRNSKAMSESARRVEMQQAKPEYTPSYINKSFNALTSNERRKLANYYLNDAGFSLGEEVVHNGRAAIIKDVGVKQEIVNILTRETKTVPGAILLEYIDKKQPFQKRTDVVDLYSTSFKGALSIDKKLPIDKTLTAPIDAATTNLSEPISTIEANAPVLNNVESTQIAFDTRITGLKNYRKFEAQANKLNKAFKTIEKEYRAGKITAKQAATRTNALSKRIDSFKDFSIDAFPSFVELPEKTWKNAERMYEKTVALQNAINDLDATHPFIADIHGEIDSAVNSKQLGEVKTENNPLEQLQGIKPSYIPTSRVGKNTRLKGYDLVEIERVSGLDRDTLSDAIRAGADKNSKIVYQSATTGAKREFGELIDDTITIAEMNALAKGLGVKSPHNPFVKPELADTKLSIGKGKQVEIEVTDKGKLRQDYSIQSALGTTIRGENQKGISGGLFGDPNSDLFAATVNATEPKANAPVPALSLRILDGDGGTPGTPGSAFKFADPELEKAYQAAKKLPAGQALLKKIYETGRDVKNYATRAYPELPNSDPFYAEAHEVLRQKKHIKSNSARKAMGLLAYTTLPARDPGVNRVDRNAFDVFSRKLFIDDLVESADKGEKLPSGWTAEEAKAELNRIAPYATSEVVQTMRARNDEVIRVVTDNLIAAAKDSGVDISELFTRENYFHHMVIDYLDIKNIIGTGKRLKLPTNRGYLHKREGSAKPYITDYITAQYDVLAQMIADTETYRLHKRIADMDLNIVEQVKADAKQKKLDDWRGAIPDGYVPWQPQEGNAFYIAQPMKSKVVKDAMANILDEFGLDKTQIAAITAAMSETDAPGGLTVGQRRREIVIPEALANTLNNLQKDPHQDLFSKAAGKLTAAWKGWTLLNPAKFFIYNVTNLFGDGGSLLITKPASVAKIPQAINELWQVHASDRQPTGDLARYMDLGGVSGTQFAQELGDLGAIKKFRELSTGKPDLNLIRKYWRGVRIGTDFREQIFRYAMYLKYLDDIRKSPEGKPKDFGASIPEVVMALSDPHERAYKLANDALGAYDDSSAMVNKLSSTIYPFARWPETAFKRNLQLFTNAVKTSDGTAQVAGKLGYKTVAIAAVNIGRLALLTGGFRAMLDFHNNLYFREEEESLSASDRNMPHIILGRNSDGSIRLLRAQGAIDEVLSWVGAEEYSQDIRDILTGKRTFRAVAGEYLRGKSVKAFINKAVGGVTPFIKVPVEALTGKQYFPNAFQPRQIRDYGEYIAGQVSLRNEYKALTGKPGKPYRETLLNYGNRTYNPEQGAYYEILDIKSDFTKNTGAGMSFVSTPKSDALYYYKQALQLNDKEAQTKYLDLYFRNGGNAKGLRQSLQKSHPFYSLTSEEEKAFVDSLDDTQKKKLAIALKFYSNMVNAASIPEDDKQKLISRSSFAKRGSISLPRMRIKKLSLRRHF